MYNYVNAKQLIETINNGWTPTWFAVENEELSVDLCVDYRLTDGKVLFLKVQESNLEELLRLSEEVADLTAKIWAENIAKCKQSLKENIEEMRLAKENYRKTQWKLDHVYKIVNGNEEDYYRCVEVDENNSDYVYLQNLVERQYEHLSIFYRDPAPIQSLIGENTLVFDEGYQPDRNCI